MVEIKNTISFAYPDGCAKPTMGELAIFVKSLDANTADMEAVYRIGEEHSVFIKFRSEDSMQYALAHNSEKLAFHYSNGKVVEVTMTLAGGNRQYVRVYDLPPEVPDNDLVSVFNKYGKVKRVVREKFPVELGLNMFTGVRGVYMDVEKEIPSSLTFLNRKGNIFYSGNKDRCFRCQKEGHRMNSCPARKIQEQQQQQVKQKNNTDEQENCSNSTYALVAAGGTPLDIINHENEQHEEEDEEEEENEEVIHEEVVPDKDVVISEAGTKEDKPQKPLVFKYPNDAYYYYKFGIVDYTEKEREKDEAEAKRLAEWKEKRLQEELERQKKKTAEKLRSPPRKSKKSC